MKYVVGVDIGGTFTDLVSVDETGDYIIVKTSSTPADPSIAVIDGLKKLATKYGKKDIKGYLADVLRICHGTPPWAPIPCSPGPEQRSGCCAPRVFAIP